jgi:hypothetical protein
MSVATLTTTPLPALGPTGRRLEIDCPHGTTTITTANAEGGAVVTDANAVRGCPVITRRPYAVDRVPAATGRERDA